MSIKISYETIKFHLPHTVPPTVHVQPKVTVNEGEALEIACRVDANPGVTSIYWTFNKPIHQGRHSEKLTLYSSHSNRLDGSRLKIPHTRAFHTGEYYCHAETGIYTPNDLMLSQKLLTLKEIWSIWQNRSTLYAPVNLTINYPPGQPTLTMIHSTNNKGEDYISLRCQLNISCMYYQSVFENFKPLRKTYSLIVINQRITSLLRNVDILIIAV
ncbi:unnamed protein product [Trichobilharzia regenti]|nr:unnamed protein product [Trichobilharzia regenti]